MHRSILEIGMQIEIDGIVYVSHPAPARRGDQHLMAMVDLAPFGLENKLEQLWLRATSEGYEICCIPFWPYGMALGDTVAVSEDNRVTRVIAKSGRFVLRVMFVHPGPSPEFRDRLQDALATADLMYEWDEDRYVALDIPEKSQGQAVYDLLAPEVHAERAYWEWSDVRPFATL
jgi:hypothetical protein